MEFTEFTKIFWSTLEKTEKTERLEVRANGCTMVDIRTDLIIHDLLVYVCLGMNVSTEQKDDKTVMGHNKHNNQKWNITSVTKDGIFLNIFSPCADVKGRRLFD